MIVEIPDDNLNIKDLISREDLIRVIKTECNPYGAPTIDYKSGLRVLEIIDRAPTVVNKKLTTERPQGEWLPIHTDFYKWFYKCSVCGREIDTKGKPLSDYPFCHCGTQMMRGEKE